MATKLLVATRWNDKELDGDQQQLGDQSTVQYHRWRRGIVPAAPFKYLARHNSRHNIPPWFSPTEPKPVDEKHRAKAYWNVLVYAKNTGVRVNTIDVRIINKKDKKVTLLEMSCPWMENREAKESEKTMRYVPLRRF